MTISSTLRVATFIGNSVATVFPFTFPVYDSADLEVRLYNRADNTYAVIPEANYSASGIGPDSVGGAVAYNPGGVPIPDTQLLAIYRTVSYTQDTDITNQDGFYPDVLEKQLDKIVMQIQQIAEQVGRTFIFPPTVDITSEEFVASTIHLNGMLLGGGTSFPLTRLDGSPLQPGDIFTLTGQSPTSLNGIYGYVGPGWAKGSEEGTLETEGYAFVDAGDTIVPVPGGYTVGAFTVYLNGRKLIPGETPGLNPTDPDVNISDGSNIVFAAGLLEQDDVVAWTKKKPFEITNIYAGDVQFTPAGGIAATSVQGAIEELDAEKVSTSRQITTGGLLTGGGSLAADRTFSVPKASTATVIAGTDDTQAVTALGVAAAITASGISPAYSLISSGVTSGAQSELIIPLGSGYKMFKLLLDNWKPDTNGSHFTMHIATDGVPTFIASGTSYIYTGRRMNINPGDVAWNGLTSGFPLCELPQNGATGMGAYEIDIFNSGSDYGSINAISNYRRSDAGQYKERVEMSGSYYGSAVRWTHIRISPSSGSISNGGLYRLIGIV